MLRRLAAALLPALVGVAVPAAGAPAEGLADRLQYLYRQLDRGAVDLQVAVPMTQDPLPEARRVLAQTLASVADPGLLPLVQLYARDTDPLVREQTMLAAGRIGPAALDVARQGLGDTSTVVRQAAVWAACHGGDAAVEPVLRWVREQTDEDLLEAALGQLWRLGDGRWEAVAASYAGAASPRVRRAAAAGLARSGATGRVAALVQLSGDDEPVIRATALLGLRSGAVPDDLAGRLAAALGDPDWRVQTAACSVLADRQEVTLDRRAGDAVAGLWRSGRSHLAVEAVRAAALRPAVGDDRDLERLTVDAGPWLGSEALVALARRGWAEAATVAGRWIADEATWRRAAAARAARWLPGPVGAKLAATAQHDVEAAVRLAWLDGADPSSAEVRAAAVEDADPVVRAAALEAWVGAGDTSPAVERLLELAQQWSGADAAEARAVALTAALRRVAPEGRTAILQRGFADPEPAVVAHVAAAARELGLPATAPPRPPRHGDGWYRELATWGRVGHWIDLVTVRGTVRIRLDPAARLSGREISDLAAAGFYDGLQVHRVVPDFVVQGGDPRGDGWGGPGFTLPDEPSGAPFDSWRVGIATAGPGTGGSQLFVTLLPADRLTGHYTNLGQVVRGREVVTRLEVGDRILRAEVAEGTEPPPPVPVSVGEIEPEQLAALAGWDLAADSPPPDAEALDRLRAHASDLRLVVVLGTWCDDSRRELPALQRVLAAVPALSSRLVGVDRSRRLPLADPDRELFPGGIAAAVPTVVLLSADGRELGRVVERAEGPWELVLADLADAAGER